MRPYLVLGTAGSDTDPAPQGKPRSPAVSWQDFQHSGHTLGNP